LSDMICPLIGTCKAKVDAEKYLRVCTNVSEDAYKDCEIYKSTIAGVKTPAEWGKVFAPGVRP